MGTLLHEVMEAKMQTNMNEFKETISKVEGKIVNVKTELVESLQACFVLSEADLDRITSWAVEVRDIKDQMNDLMKQFEAQKDAYTSSSDELVTVDEILKQSTNDIELLTTLVKIVTDLEYAETNTEHLKASVVLNNSIKSLRQIAPKFTSPEDRLWIQHLAQIIDTQIFNTFEHTQKAWNDVFRFNRNRLSVDTFGPKVSSIIDTLRNLDFLPKVWSKFTNQLWTEILQRLCTPDYDVKISRPIVRREVPGFSPPDSLEDKNSKLHQQSMREFNSPRYIIQVDHANPPVTKVQHVFENISGVLKLLAELFDDKPEIMIDLGRDLGSRMCNALNTNCLKKLILHNSNGDIEVVQRDIQALNDFCQFLKSIKFIIPEQDEQILIDFSFNFKVLFHKQLREDILTKTRDFIKADVHTMVKYRPQQADTQRHRTDVIKSPFKMQEYQISKSIFDMIEMLKAHLKVNEDDGILPEHAFNIYLAIVSIPKHDVDSSDLVPLTAALICNNSWFLSRHAGVTFKYCEDKIPLLRTKADQAFSFLMRSIRTKLNVMIGVALTGLEEKVEAKKNCSLDFLNIAAELLRLDEIFKSVLPADVWAKGLALLVDHTVNEMVSKVLSWDDISANTANELAASFIKFAVEVSHLFKGDATSVRQIDALTSKAVEKWQRFRLLTFVLTASMSEIGDKWVQGCGPLAAEFSAEEIRKLVRSLFQNTDRRAAFLSSIK